MIAQCPVDTPTTLEDLRPDTHVTGIHPERLGSILRGPRLADLLAVFLGQWFQAARGVWPPVPCG